MKGIEYNNEISLSQVIACKKRLNNETSLASTEASFEESKQEFSDEFYDRIEAFLDDQGIFIVSPAPVREQKNYLSLLKKTHSMIEKDQESEPLTFEKIRSYETPKTDSWLGGVKTSTLLQRRKKFNTVDCVFESK